MSHYLTKLKKGISCCLSSPIYGVIEKHCQSISNLNAREARCFLEKVSSCPQHMYQRHLNDSYSSTDVSVIVPVYNVENYVSECLESIVRQDFSGSLEIIVVNDGSTDASASIAHSFEQFDCVRVIDQKNGGLSAARNAGLSLARGKYLMFVDSDDILAPGYIESLQNELQKSDADYVTSTFNYMDDDGTVREPESARDNWMAPWGRLYRREVWKDLCFPVGAWYEDLIHPLCIDPVFSEKKCYGLSGYCYRIRPGSIMQSTPSNVKGLDSYWVLDELISWRKQLGFIYGKSDYEKILPLFGPLLLGRTVALNNKAREALFICCCETFCSINEFSSFNTVRGSKWPDVELSLRMRDYNLWLLSALALSSSSDVGLSLSDALKIFKNRKQ